LLVARDKPYYPHAPIATVSALAKALAVSPKLLTDLARDVSSSYTSFVISSKNKEREVWEPKYELKRLQKRINSRIFEHVAFPRYLQGGIKDFYQPRDYVANGIMHAGSKLLISLDIKNFYDNIRVPSVLAIFQHFFHFSEDVADLLTRLVTLNGRVPQGACTSSYIANLVFFNSEYSFVSKLRNKGLLYTRLLDDVTISSPRLISQDEATEIIKDVAGLFKRHNLRLNQKKTKIERADDLRDKYEVTGLWVGSGAPKLRRAERHHIRHLVYICEQEYRKDPCCDSYHTLWNRVSGHVAKLSRLGHVQAVKLRLRMGDILPVYDDKAKAKVIYDCERLLKRPLAMHKRMGVIKSFHRTIYALGILGRTDKKISRHLKRQLRDRFGDIPIKREIWE
jgi:hypothetical protein